MAKRVTEGLSLVRANTAIRPYGYPSDSESAREARHERVILKRGGVLPS